jgi:hypothetical protein
VANAFTLTMALTDAARGDVVELVTPGIEDTTSTYYSGGFSVDAPGISSLLPVVMSPPLGSATRSWTGGDKPRAQGDEQHAPGDRRGDRPEWLGPLFRGRRRDQQHFGRHPDRDELDL